MGKFRQILKELSGRDTTTFSFVSDNLSKLNGFYPNMVVYAMILWRSGSGILMCKFRQILTELSARDTPIFSFPDDNLSKCQGILTRLGICIDI